MVDELTTAQELQDGAFMRNATEEFIKPLYEEIVAQNPDYKGYTFADMFAYLVNLESELMLDEERDVLGDALMLDFGNNMWAYVHSGVELGQWRRAGESKAVEAFYYVPRFVADIHHNRHSVFSELDRGNVAAFLENERDTYESLAIPYRVALLSLYVFQNVVTDLEHATHRVAACGKYLDNSRELSPGFRFQAKYWLGADGRCKGWNIRIRDLKPPKPWWLDLATHLRENTFAIDDCYGDGAETDNPPKDRKPRGNQDRTNAAIAFIYDYLPSIGKKPGKGGYSWKAAFRDFEERHPKYKGEYSDSVSFSKSVRQGRKRRDKEEKRSEGR